MEEKVIKSIASGASVTLIGTIFGLGLKFGSRALFARGLGPKEYGAVMLGLSFLYLLNSVGGLGLSSSLSRFIPYFERKEEYGKLKGVMLVSLLLLSTFNVVLGFVSYISSKFVAEQIFGDADLVNIVKVFSATLPVFSIGMLLKGGLRGFRRMDYIEYGKQGVRQAGLFGVAVASIVYSLNSVAVSLGFSLIFVVMTFTYFILILKSSDIFRKWSNIKAIYIPKKLFNFSWPLVASQQLKRSWRRIDTILVGYFTTSSLVGIYNVALPLSRLNQLFLNSINGIFLPSITSLYASGKREEMRKTYAAAAKWTFMLTLPAYLTLVLNAETVIVMTFGKEYSSAKIALIILSSGFLANSISGSYGEVLTSVGKTRVNMWISVVTVMSNVIMNILMIPEFEIMGAAISSATSLVLASVLGCFYLYREYEIQPFGPSHLKAIIVAASVTVYLLSVRWVVPSDYIGYILPIIFMSAYILFFIGCAKLGVLTFEEKRIFIAAKQKYNIF